MTDLNSKFKYISKRAFCSCEIARHIKKITKHLRQLKIENNEQQPDKITIELQELSAKIRNLEGIYNEWIDEINYLVLTNSRS